MFHKGVCDADPFEPDIDDILTVQAFENGTAKTAMEHIFFNRDDFFDALGEIRYQFRIQWFDEAAVDHRCLDAFSLQLFMG